VLLTLAESIGLDPRAFNAAFNEILGAETQAHINDSRQWLAKVGGQGFPTLALEQNGQLQLLDISPWLGKPEAFVEWLRQRVAISIQPTQSSAPMCGLQGCADPGSA